MADLAREYTPLEPLGKGSFGEAWKVLRVRDKKVYVWKIVKYAGMEEKKLNLLKHEVMVLKNLNHPNIVRYRGLIDDPAAGVVRIVMEYCSGGDLAGLIEKLRESKFVLIDIIVFSFCSFFLMLEWMIRQRIPEDEVWKIIAQLVYALAYCHEYSETVTSPNGGTQVKKLVVLHRDIKPGNVFLADKVSCTVKLGDFGLSKILNQQEFTQTVLGSPSYMAPEIWQNHPYNEKCDVWSLGCLIHELCMLTAPFIGSSLADLGSKVIKCRRETIPNTLYSADIERVVAAMLTTDVCFPIHVVLSVSFSCCTHLVFLTGEQETINARFQTCSKDQRKGYYAWPCPNSFCSEWSCSAFFSHAVFV